MRYETVKATRKAHRCDWCGEGIPIGSEARTLTFPHEGSLVTTHRHPECAKACQESDLTEDDLESCSAHTFKRGTAELR